MILCAALLWWWPPSAFWCENVTEIMEFRSTSEYFPCPPSVWAGAKFGGFMLVPSPMHDPSNMEPVLWLCVAQFWHVLMCMFMAAMLFCVVVKLAVQTLSLDCSEQDDSQHVRGDESENPEIDGLVQVHSPSSLQVPSLVLPFVAGSVGAGLAMLMLSTQFLLAFFGFA